MRTSPHEDDAAVREATAAPERGPLFPSEREAREFAAGAGGSWVGARLRYFETTDSTSTRARRLADLGWPAGTVVVADEQTAGRGRMGSRWTCPARAGLLVSVVLPRPEGVSPTWLTAAGALAMAEAARDAIRDEASAASGPMIEWPNDIVAADPAAPGGRRKLGGVIVEARPPPEDGLAARLVLGAGLNVDVRGDEFPPELRAGAASLASAFGASPDRRKILGRFIIELESRVDGLAGGLAGLKDELRARSFTLGREVDLPGAGPGREARTGRAVGFDDEMRLVVELPGGETETMAFRASGVRDIVPRGNS